MSTFINPEKSLREKTQPENDMFGNKLACVVGGIVRTSKVMAEELRSRAGNGEETF